MLSRIEAGPVVRVNGCGFCVVTVVNGCCDVEVERRSDQVRFDVEGRPD